MSKMSKMLARLRAANPQSQPRTPGYTGSGQWLYWHTPGGDRVMVGITIELAGITYRQIITADECADMARQLWGDTTAWQLGKLLSGTMAATLGPGTALPAGISSEPIAIVNGDTPADILDALWQAGPAQSLLLKKKPPSVSERFIEGGNSPEQEPASPAPAAHSRD